MGNLYAMCRWTLYEDNRKSLRALIGDKNAQDSNWESVRRMKKEVSLEAGRTTSTGEKAVLPNKRSCIR